MRKRISKMLFLLLFPVVMFVTAGIFSFSVVSTAYAWVVKDTSGGLFRVEYNSTLNISGGSISGATGYNGGAIYVGEGGTFNFSGGSIFGNIATELGNQIYNSGTFNMTGGIIGEEPAVPRVDENGNKDSNGNYVLFGSYPQTIKADDVTIDATNVDSNGYYLGSDGERYAKLNSDYFKVEPLLWEILKISDGKAVILTKSVIDCHQFDSTLCVYGTSEIRAWLNDDFYNQAFSQKDKNIIQTTLVDNSAASTGSSSNANACEDTNDNVWLLSQKELKKNELSPRSFSKQGTDFAVSKGVPMSPVTKNCYWMTRSPSSNTIISIVESSGIIGISPGTSSEYGVVPAITITFEESQPAEGYGIYNTGTMNLYGGDIYEDIYSSGSMSTKMGANISGTITLGKSATIIVEDYAGTTPSYSIVIDSTRGEGTILTFKGSSTEPDLSKLNITGYDSDMSKLKTQQDDNGNWTVELYPVALWFAKDWKTQVASTTYMTTTITSADLTSIKFVATVPDGYTKIGTLSTGLPVYQGTTATEIAFVCEKIYAPVDSSDLFYSRSKLTEIDTSVLDTSKVTNMRYMFGSCSSLTNLDVSKFDTTNVTRMDVMFVSCSKLENIDLSNFITTNVTSMSTMFSGCSSLISLNLSNFNTSKVTDMSSMFSRCSSLTSLDLSSFDTSNVTNMSQMFIGCSKLESLVIGNFDTSKVTDMKEMFSSCTKLSNLDTSGFDTSNVTNMYYMFGSCSSLTNLDVSSFDTSKVTNMQKMFSYCSLLTTLDLSNFRTPNVTDMSYLFWYSSKLTNIDMSNFDTSKVTNMQSMFLGCSKLTSLDVSSFDTSNVTNMLYMFSNCTNLKNLDLTNFNTSKVTNMSEMFSSSSSLESLDLSSFDTTSVTNMSRMFYNCSGLKSLNLSSFNMSKVSSTSNMLYFGSANKIETFKTPYNNTSALSITTLSKLYNQETGDAVTSVPAKTTKSLTYVNEYSTVDFPSTWRTELADSTYMGSNKLTNPQYSYSIGFYFDIPSGYTLIGTLSTGLQVYADSTKKNIAFVSSSIIMAPTDCTGLFKNTGEAGESNIKITFENFNTRNVVSMKSMFEQAMINGILDLSVFNTSNVTDMSNMFSYCTPASGVILSSFDTSKVTNMSYMFNYSLRLANELILTSFDTSNVIDMSFMFADSSRIKIIDVSSFNTLNVTNMDSMFYYCSSLTSIDLSKFNTSKVTNMKNMFCGCSSLTSLDLSSFDTLNVTNMYCMFDECSSLLSLDLSSFDMSKVTIYTSMLDFGTTNTIQTLKTPYNNTSSLVITTKSTLYNLATGERTRTIPANLTASVTFSSTKPSSFIDGEYDICLENVQTSFENQIDEVLLESKRRFVLKNKKVLQEN